MDGLLQLSYSPTYELEMFIRYRYKKKEKDFTAEDKTKQTIPSIQQKCRYQLNYSVKDKLTLKTIADYVRINFVGNLLPMVFWFLKVLLIPSICFLFSLI